MRIVLEHFALLCDLAGAPSETVSTEASTLGELWLETSRRLGVQAERSSFRPARNDEFAEWDDALAEGDRVSFLPPFAGG